MESYPPASCWSPHIVVSLFLMLSLLGLLFLFLYILLLHLLLVLLLFFFLLRQFFLLLSLPLLFSHWHPLGAEAAAGAAFQAQVFPWVVLAVRPPAGD